MMLDARELDDGSIVEADLAIVGGGAAGIAIARTFIGTATRVVLIESGGLDFDPDVQDLYQGRNIGLPYFDLDASRLRYFGGTTNHWAGRSRPLDPIDFEERSWVPHSGWPITFDVYMAYVEPAQEVCQMGPVRYDPEYWEFPKERLLPFDDGVFRNLVWQFSPISFGEAYRDELTRHDNIEILLHANVVDILTDPEARVVEGLSIATIDGPRLTVRARAHVLACGGLENPRLLLAARSVRPQGLGNDHDLVGRFFMEHPHLRVGRVLITDPERDGDLYMDRSVRHGVTVKAHLGASASFQRDAGLLNYQAYLRPDSVGDSGYAALRRLGREIVRGRWPEDLSGDIASVVTDLGDTFAGVMGRLGLRDYRAPGAYWLAVHLEQAPNPQSRVQLGSEEDALGMPRIELEWRLTKLDWRSLQAIQEMLGREMGRLGVGRLQIEPWLESAEPQWPDTLSGGNHHMGTTRMSDDPRNGVVDRDCRVHGIDNLYIAGSSVFPTGGCVNPTLSIVALALRLADHLEERLRT